MEGLSAVGVQLAPELVIPEKDMACPQMGGAEMFNYWMQQCLSRQRAGGGCSALRCPQGNQVYAMLTGQFKAPRAPRKYSFRKSVTLLCECGRASLHEDLLKSLGLTIPVCHECRQEQQREVKRARARDRHARGKRGSPPEGVNR